MDHENSDGMRRVSWYRNGNIVIANMITTTEKYGTDTYTSKFCHWEDSRTSIKSTTVNSQMYTSHCSWKNKMWPVWCIHASWTSSQSPWWKNTNSNAHGIITQMHETHERRLSFFKHNVDLFCTLYSATDLISKIRCFASSDQTPVYMAIFDSRLQHCPTTFTTFCHYWASTRVSHKKVQHASNIQHAHSTGMYVHRQEHLRQSPEENEGIMSQQQNVQTVTPMPLTLTAVSASKVDRRQLTITR